MDIIKSISPHTDIIELGFPHNTPIADGGQIQESSHRALKKGIKISDVFDALCQINGVCYTLFNNIESEDSDSDDSFHSTESN